MTIQTATKSIADRKGKGKIQMLTGDIWIIKGAGKYVAQLCVCLL